MAKLELVERGRSGAVFNRIALADLAAALDFAALDSGMIDRAHKQAQRYETDRDFHAVTLLRTYGNSRLATRHKRVQRLLAQWHEHKYPNVDYETGEVFDAKRVA